MQSVWLHLLAWTFAQTMLENKGSKIKIGRGLGAHLLVCPLQLLN